jgi:hypothetical protein
MQPKTKYLPWPYMRWYHQLKKSRTPIMETMKQFLLGVEEAPGKVAIPELFIEHNMFRTFVEEFTWVVPGSWQDRCIDFDIDNNFIFYGHKVIPFVVSSKAAGMFPDASCLILTFTDRTKRSI